MEITKTDKKIYIWIIASCFVMYTMSISIKMVYSAELVSIISYFNTTKSVASLGLTVYYLIYAAAQLLLSMKKKKFDMHKFLVYTTVASAISFGAVIFATNIWQVWIILALNGILQSSVWGGIIQCLTKFLPEEWFNRTSIILSLAFALGTAISYGTSALGVAFFDWKFAFVLFAVLLLISLVVFCVVIHLAKRRFGDVDHAAASTKGVDESALRQPMDRRKVIVMLGFILFVDFFVCSLYYGTTNWVPSLLKEVHGVPESYSLLITILVPVSMSPGPILANTYAERTGKIYNVCTAFLALCSMCMLTMIFLHGANLVLAIVLSLLSLFFNRGIVNLLSGYMPFKLNRVVPAGKTSLMINAVACIGAAVMPFVTGLIMDHFGWTAYYICMFAVAAVMTLVFIFASRNENKLLP